MNERIVELIKQAGGIQCDEDGDELIPILIGTDLEKFAELIVAECIGIAQDRAAFDGFPPNDVNDIIDEIREHFGVEE